MNMLRIQQEFSQSYADTPVSWVCFSPQYSMFNTPSLQDFLKTFFKLLWKVASSCDAT